MSEEHAGGTVRTGVAQTATAAAEAALNAKLSRKRTKTGCLTCRKRRVKCGEEKPICSNCIKSKRICQGYNQRVIFRPPTFEYQAVPNNGGAHITFQAQISSGLSSDLDTRSSSGDLPGHTQLRPRPTEQPFAYLYDGEVRRDSREPYSHSEYARAAGFKPENFYHNEQMQDFQPFQQPYPLPFVSSSQETLRDAPMTFTELSRPLRMDTQPAVTRDAVGVFYPLPHGTSATASASSTHQFDTSMDDTALHVTAHPLMPPLAQSDQAWLSSNTAPSAPPGIAAPTPISSRSFDMPSHFPMPSAPPPQQWMPTYTPYSNLAQPSEYQYNQAQSFSTQDSSPQPVNASHTIDMLPDYYHYQVYASPISTPAHLLSAAAVETVDDDYYDVASDEEIDFNPTALPQNESERQQTLTRFLALNEISLHNLQARRYDTFLYEGILDHYRIDEVASPLKNPATARIFAHFISATGPSLSIFERHPRNTSVLFTEGSVPLSQQGLWTYTMPMAALRHQGLLHAMLAMASLHIAKLQNVSITPSIQHYAWSLKRVHKAVGNPKSRLKLTTIAASLLLGYYEVMTADHMKWNMHLTGSRQLFLETDFAGMTREVCRLKEEKAARQRSGPDFYNAEASSSVDDLLNQVPDIDERMVSQLVGRQVRYYDYGRIEAQYSVMPPEIDLNKFEILKDLYFWYLRQDAYQSIVSGNPLLMDYGRWANCPPRAPLGRADAVYGSYDHLMLLLGRIGDFAARDRERKLRQMRANGGQWRPAPGMKIARPPKPPANSGVPAPPPAMPEFYGMAPPPRTNVQMPSSYTPMPGTIPSSQNPRQQDAFDADLQAATKTAMEEYASIRAALHTFATSLGDAFEPLTSEYAAPMDTPFGPALFYRSYDIGCLWSIYNMAVIVAIRSHPHMPPAAHMAAGIAAPETAFFANQIGRIAAGIVPGPPDQPLNPSLGASLCESCMPSFLAAVQYRDAQQRHTTVTRIFSISQRTGWGSAELIANGIETAWVKAAAAGRGPPYERIARTNYQSNDPRLNGSWERQDPNASPSEMDEGDRRLIKVQPTARLLWAFGVMGVEDDLAKIKLSDG